MNNIKKILTGIISASAMAAALLPVAPVSAKVYENALDCHDYDYITDNTEISGLNGMYLYKDGTGVNELKFYQQFILTPAEGIKLTPELLELPAKYTLTADENGKTVRLPKLIVYKKETNNPDITEVKDMVTTWLRKGYISKADIEYSASGKCLRDPRMAVKVKDEIAPAEVAADYPEYEFTTDRTDVPYIFFDCVYSHFIRDEATFYTRTVNEGEIFDDWTENSFLRYLCHDRMNAARYDTKKDSTIDRNLINRIQWIHIFGNSCCDDEHTVSKTVPFSDEYTYLDDPENILWTYKGRNDNETLTYYKDETLYAGPGKYTAVTFTPAVDYTELQLSDKYNIEHLKNMTMGIKIQSDEELEEVRETVRNWAEKGLVKEPAVNNFYRYEKLNGINILVKLINNYTRPKKPSIYDLIEKAEAEGLDIDELIEKEGPELLEKINNYEEEPDPFDPSPFISDHPELKINVVSEKFPHELECTPAEPEMMSEFPEIMEELKADSRVEAVYINYGNYYEYISDVPSPIEYERKEEMDTDNEYLKEEQYTLKGDADLDGKVDIHDAISVAKVIAGSKELTAAEMSAADVNGNGKIDLYDVIEIAKLLL